MAFVSIRDMRTRPSEVWQQLKKDGDLILTSSGQPFALMISAQDEDIEALLIALRRARAQVAAAQLRKQAAVQGVDRLSTEEIEAEILQTRRDRQR